MLHGRAAGHRLFVVVFVQQPRQQPGQQPTFVVFVQQSTFIIDGEQQSTFIIDGEQQPTFVIDGEQPTFVFDDQQHGEQYIEQPGQQHHK